MAHVVIEQGAERFQVALAGATSIGRDSGNRIVIADARVLPKHAWIREDRGQFYVEDAPNGPTQVNNSLLIGNPYLLRDGDQLQIGPATITFFQEESGTPAEPPAGRPETVQIENGRIKFACECGASLRVRAEYAGRAARCKRCGHRLVVPSAIQSPVPATPADLPFPVISPPPVPLRGSLSPVVAAPPPALRPKESSVGAICGICQCSIEESDEWTTCPRCSLPYHAECWIENLGCAAYGCSQVNALKAGPDIRIAHPPPLPSGYVAAVSRAEPESDIPWDFLLLGASAVGLLLSCVWNGLPSLVLGALACAYIIRSHKRPIGAPVYVSLAISVLGLLAGLLISNLQ